MEVKLKYRGREVTDEDITFIQRLMSVLSISDSATVTITEGVGSAGRRARCPASKEE
ncbi:MAG: hypothetical protein GY720_16295 [bacterium]|nr:hypothetical protein [bacterium]